VEFAWRYLTDIANWNDPPAQFTIDGPFEAGVTGTTVLPGQGPFHWRIREVQTGKFLVQEMQLDRATLSFEWSFDELPGHRTKLTQRIILAGDNAGAYSEQVEAAFRPNLPAGMQRLASQMAAAEKRCAG